jgi:DNA polymerase III delta prime subunit
MKANSIEDSLNLFDPHHPLLEEDDIKAYYVARDNSPIEEMKTILKTATHFPKLLFSGPPGCGKSTELAKLKEMLKKDFHIIIFSVKEITNTFRIDLDSMLFHILKKVADKAKEENLSIYSEKLEKVISSGIDRDSDIELASAAKDGNGIESVLDDILSEDEQKEGLGYGSIFGPVFRRPFKPRADALLNLINDTVWDLEEKTKKDVLVLVTDMDKLKLGNVYGLLTSSSLYLTKIQCFVVYTFPFELKYRNDFIDINRNFNGVYFLPNFIPYNRLGEPDENVQKKLKEIITKRIQSKLIYDEAVDLIVKLSGGIVYELINLVRQCCIIALMEKINFIDDEVVKDAEQRIRRVYRSVYSNEERKLLLQVRQNKEFINTDAGKKLFNQLSFTEYGTGDDIWHDVNPILFPLLEEIELA